MTSGNIALLTLFGAAALIIFIVVLFDYLRKRSADQVKIAQVKIREKELDIAMAKHDQALSEQGLAPGQFRKTS